MAKYYGPNGLVEALQWSGQALSGLTIEEKKWGTTGVIQTSEGPAWVTPGDWLVSGSKGYSIVSPMMFSLWYSA